jgi:hypothetical protein
MAHFAELDANNIVQRVIVVGNDQVNNLPFPESEPLGIEFINTFLPGKTWVQTSYNNNFRLRYAGIGMKYYPDSNTTPYGAFGNTQEQPNWIFDESECMWYDPAQQLNIQTETDIQKLIDQLTASANTA